MPARDSRSQRGRARIAELAARFISEHGIQDYSLAKRKAARQLGLPDSQGLPSNEEVDAALIQRRDLYDPEEQAGTLAALRQQAIAVMGVFQRFEPVLTGAVASGAVSEHSLIELEILADSSKDFEQFLVNRGIEFKVQDRGGRMAYLIYAEPTDVSVRLLAADNHHAQSVSRPRLTLSQLKKLVDGSQES
jgi:hypothetical protein